MIYHLSPAIFDHKYTVLHPCSNYHIVDADQSQVTSHQPHIMRTLTRVTLLHAAVSHCEEMEEKVCQTNPQNLPVEITQPEQS